MRRLAALCLGLLSGCSAAPGDDALGSVQEALLSNCSTGRLSDGAKQHSCEHYTYGPFKSRTATTAAPYPWFGIAASDPTPHPPTTNYGATHSYYTVALSASGGSYAGKMRFRPVSSGDHTLLFNNASLTIKPEGGSNLTPDAAISPSPGAMSCAGFSGYLVFSLSSSVTYEVSFSSSSATANILFEQVSESVKRWYQDADGDTWGNPTGSLLTACAPPAGYSAERGSDCNDGSASINPTATEVCGDAIDSNCNGNDCT